MSTPQVSSRIMRLRYALALRDPRWTLSPRFGPWVLVALGIFGITFSVLALTADGPSAQRPGSGLMSLGQTALHLFLLSLGAGELLYGKSRVIAGLSWVAALFVFAPATAVLFAATAYSQESFWFTPLMPVALAITYGFLLWRYRSAPRQG